MIPWTMSRPYASVAPKNDDLGDRLIPSDDRSQWGTPKPEDATLIFWNRVPWHLGPPNGQVWVRFLAPVVHMTNPIQDEGSTVAS